MMASDKPHIEKLYHAFENGEYSLSTRLLAELESTYVESTRTLKSSSDSHTLLHLACHHGWLDVVKRLIEEYGYVPDVKDRVKQTPLHYACRYGHLDIVQYLTSHQHCDVTAITLSHLTPLHYACRYGYMSIVEYLASLPSVVNSVDQSSVLHLTCKYNNSKILTYLMDKKGFTLDPQSKQKISGLLHQCESDLSIPTINKLLTSVSNYQNMALDECKEIFMFCCKHGLLDIVKQITQTVSEVSLTYDESGKSGIHYACQKSHVAIVQHLVEECRCNINTPDQDSLTPLHLACKYGQNINLVRYLLTRSTCDILARSDDGSTALHFACTTEKFDPQIMNVLIKHGAVMSKQLLSSVEIFLGSSTLEATDISVKSAIVSCLLDIAKCDPKVMNYAGISPVQISTYPFLVRSILACHAETCIHKWIQYDSEYYAIYKLQSCVYACELDLNETSSNGDTVLHMACAANKVKIAKYLLHECNFDPNIKNNAGDTPLMLALRFQTYKMLPYEDLTGLVSLFVKSGTWNPAIHEKDKDGNTLQHLACQANQHELINVLEELFGSMKFERNNYEYVPYELLSSPRIIVNLLINHAEKSAFTYIFKPGYVHQFNWFCKNIEKKQLQRILIDNSLKLKWEHKESLSIDNNCHIGHHMLYLPGHQIWLLMKVCFHSHVSTSNLDIRDCQHIFVIDIIDYLMDTSFKGGESNEQLLYSASQGNRYLFVRHLFIKCNTDHKLTKDKRVKFTNDYLLSKVQLDDIEKWFINNSQDIHPDTFNILRQTKRWYPDLICNSNCDTALHLSARYHRYEVAHYLLSEAKCDPNIKNQRDETPVGLLMFSLLKQNSSDSECIVIIDDLMSTGKWEPNSSCNSSGDTALHLSVWHHRHKIVQHLLTSAKCDPYFQNQKGETPIQLLLAVNIWPDSECIDIVNVLVSIGLWNPNSSCNSNGDTAFYLSVWYHRYNLALHLLSKAKCDPNIRNLNGRQPINLMVSLESWSNDECICILEQLISTGLWDPNLSYNSQGDTVLHLSARHHKPEVAHFLLIKTKCDPNIKNLDGEKLINLLITTRAWSDSECVDIIKVLTSTKRLDPNSICNSQGDRVLHLLVKHHMYKVALYWLSEAKCDPNIANLEGEKPISLLMSIQLWSSFECINVIEQLKSTGLWDPNSSCNHNEDTVLHLSIKYHKYELTHYLLSTVKCDPHIRNLNGETQIQLLLPSVIRTWPDSECKDMINDLISTEKWDQNSICCSSGDTALHLSVRHCRPVILIFLLYKAKCDPNVKNIHGETPLLLANDTGIIKILICYGANPENAYKSLGKTVGLTKPLVPPVKIFIIGNSGVGKSTLTEALKIESSLLVRIFTPRKRVSGVNEKTAGIVPHGFESKLYGQVIIYDFAGQREFYNSHIAILQNVIQSSSPIFLIVVNLSNNEKEVQQNIRYWLSFVEHTCSTAHCKPYIIIIGSYADIALKRGDNLQRTTSEMSNYVQEISQDLTLEYVGMYPIDCRYSESTSIQEVRSCLKHSCKSLRISDTISFNAHCFHVFLLDKFRTTVAVTIDELRIEIMKTTDNEQKGVVSYLPDSVSVLNSVCDELNDRGHILFLKNNDNLEKSWVIIDKTSLISKVTGTIFAPNDFKEHCQIAESTGVVPLSRLTKTFPEYRSEVLIGFLTHLEYCHKIDDQVLRELISKHQDSLKSATTIESENEHYFLFPGLITLNAPIGLWKQNHSFKYHCFWIIKCTRQDQFFSSRFTQVLLLRLAFSFALIKKEVNPAIPALLRECSIWKNGIFWGEMFGMEIIIEVHSTMVILLIRFHEGNLLRCIAKRSSIIHKVLQCVQDFGSNIETVESFINPSEATEFPLKSPVSSEIPQYSLQNIAEAIVKCTDYDIDSPSVVSSTGTVSLDCLLTFEPYVELGIAALKKLCTSENDNEKKVSDSFLEHLSHKLSKKANLFYKLFKPSSHLSSSTSEDLFTLLQTWRDECNGTYKCLKQKLDQFSVFAGRNVLELSTVGRFQEDLELIDSSDEFFSEVPGISKSPDHEQVYSKGSQKNSKDAQVNSKNRQILKDVQLCSIDDRTSSNNDTIKSMNDQINSDVFELSPAPLEGFSSASFIDGETVTPAIKHDSASYLPQPEAFPDLNAIPKLHQLHLLERYGKRVKVIDMVAAEWDSVALRLHFESYDISRIERDHPQQCIRASITVFTEWIKGKGRQPSSWHTLIEALKETRLQSVASDLDSIFADQSEPDQLQITNGSTSQSSHKTHMTMSCTNDDLDDDEMRKTEFEKAELPYSSFKPKMTELQLLESHGGRIKIIEGVAYKWKELAVALDFEEQRIDRIDSESSRVDEEACRQMFEEWLGEDDELKEPVTWATLVQCLIDAGMIDTADRLKELIFK